MAAPSHETSKKQDRHTTAQGTVAGDGRHRPQAAVVPSAALAGDSLATLARAGKHLVWTMPPDGVITDPVPAWCAFTGQSPDAARGDGWTEAVHPDDRAALLRTIAQGIATQQPYVTECRLRRADGAWRQMVVYGTPVPTPDGRLREWVGVCTDVTEERVRLAAREEALEQQRGVVRQQRLVLRRLYAALRSEHESLRQEHEARQGEIEAAEGARQARAALRASEIRFQRLVASNLIGVAVAEEDRITEANDAFLQMVGYTREDLEASRVRWREMTPPEYVSLDAQALAELVERGEWTPFEKEYWRADGKRMPALIGATLLEREPLRWVCFVVDLSERRHLEEQLRFQASMLERTHDAVFAWELGGPIVSWNRAAELLYGYQADEVVGRRMHDLLRTRWPVESLEEFEALLLRKGEWSGELTRTARDGRLVEVLSRHQVLREPDGRVYVLATSQDNTERKRLERERIELLGLVAHDLGNPLATIKTRVQLLQRQLGREAALPAQALDPIASAVRRLERLVGDLRTQESLETGQLALEQKPCDLAQLCHEEAEAARTMSGRVITLALPAGPVMAEVDHDRIGQVLSNLLSNALKYSPADRPVVLSLTTEEAPGEQETGGEGAHSRLFSRVSVRDEGPGIPAEALPHLFERFYRVPGIEVQHGAGRSLGLGLYISRQLVERHGGQVGVESVLGQGSCFWFMLPLARPAT